MFKSLVFTSASLAALAASPAVAQSEDAPFSGIYVGGSFGGGLQPNDVGSSIEFDRDLNGSFGDTVVTTTGQNAFGPNTTGGAFNGGFCNGAATTPSLGTCVNDDDGVEYKGRIGADAQFGRIVVGVVGEFGKTDIEDSVSAFSTTPARYTMTRDLRFDGNVRGRIGYAPGRVLLYGTGGAAYGRVRNSFSTSNGLNSFTTNGSSDAFGYVAGGGVEALVFGRFALGLEYLYTALEDDEARVRVGPGTALATNPFLLAGAGGTDFRRSDENFRWHSVRATVSYRF